MDLGAVNSELLAVEGVDRLIPRMESFSLLYHGTNTKGSLVMGIDLQ